jgi:protein-disulfide isomerase
LTIFHGDVIRSALDSARFSSYFSPTEFSQRGGLQTLSVHVRGDTDVENELSLGRKLNVRRVLLGACAALVLLAVQAVAPQVLAAPEKLEVDVAELMKQGDLPDNVLGKADAPNTIVEYSSMTCPHCADFHKEVMPKLKEKYIDTGKAKYILREFPLDNLAAAAFMLGRCVDKSRYFEFIDLLYKHQDEWAFKSNPVPELQKFARQVGFTEERFNQCIADEKLLKYIEWVRERANKEFGIHATPTFFINGKKLKGASSIEAFDEMLAPKTK